MITNLLTNMIVLALHGDFIPNNTPAFEQYAFQVMYTNAQSLGARWRLDQSLITSNNITRFDAKAHPRQIYTEMEFGGRYLFRTTKAGFLFFADERFCLGSDFAMWTNQALADRYGGELKQQFSTSSTLSIKAARKIAESAMIAHGGPAAELRSSKPTHEEQLKLGGDLLPYYKFEWQTEKGRCKVHISGITTNIVHFEFEGPKSLRLKPPPNYLYLLGLSTNSIFVRQVAPGEYMPYQGATTNTSHTQ
jgi:hypothetical protein